MSILKTTNSGSKSIPVTSGQTILDEIAKIIPLQVAQELKEYLDSKYKEE